MKQLLTISCLIGGALLYTACNRVTYFDEEPPGEDLWGLIVDSTFTNPVLTSGPDPWVVQKNGTYYYTYTQDSKLVILETKNMSELAIQPTPPIIPTIGSRLI